MLAVLLRRALAAALNYKKCCGSGSRESGNFRAPGFRTNGFRKLYLNFFIIMSDSSWNRIQNFENRIRNRKDVWIRIIRYKREDTGRPADRFPAWVSVKMYCSRLFLHSFYYRNLIDDFLSDLLIEYLIDLYSYTGVYIFHMGFWLVGEKI